MKRFLLPILLGIYSMHAFGQDPEILNRTWLLHSVIIDGESTTAPHTFPTHYQEAMFMEQSDDDFEFYFETCSSCSGDLFYSQTEDEFEFTFVACFANNLCFTDWQQTFNHQIYEAFFYDHDGEILSYEIIPIDTDTDSLVLTAANGDQVIYQDQPFLGLEDTFISEVSLFPNPVSEELFLDSGNTQIELLKVFNLSGQMVLQQKNANQSIDVSSLPYGMYFLEVSTSEGKAIKKFIKE